MEATFYLETSHEKISCMWTNGTKIINERLIIWNGY